MELVEIITIINLVFLILIFLIFLIPVLIKTKQKFFASDKRSNFSLSSKIRLIFQIKEAIEHLSKNKIGAIITIESNDRLDNLRTDGTIIDANISSSLIISIFNKNSPLHDGAIIIRNNKIIYASTYYKISKKSINNKYGARHRAAMGISENSDATTIIVSEETGGITIAKNGVFTSVRISNFQEKLSYYLRD